MLLARIITAAGADHEFAESLGVGFDADGAVPASTLRGRRLISDSVLVADVVRHGAADLVHFIQSAREESDSSGSLRNCLQRPAGPARFLLAQQADRIHRGTALFLQPANRLFEGFPAGIVFSV